MICYQVYYSSLAAEDLDRIWDEVYAVSRDFDISDRYVRGIREAVRQMEKRPKTGIRLYYEDIFTGVYMVIYKKYTAFYRIREERIEVGRVLPGSSDYTGTVLK